MGLPDFWCMYAHMPGNWKPLPTSVLPAFRAVRAMANNKVVLCGFTRGARWVDEIFFNNADMLHFARATAPYPQCKCEWTCRKTAREVMLVNRPILYFLFAHDSCSAAATYPARPAQIQPGMDNPPWEAIGAWRLRAAKKKRGRALAARAAPSRHGLSSHK